MRGPVITIAALIAGCGESPGLQLEVGVADTSITRIELIIGTHCEGCPGAMAAPELAPRATSIYSSPHPEAWFSDVDGTFAGFFLHVDGDADQRIPVLGIVGYDSAKQPIAYATMQDVIVPAAGEQYWRVELKPIVPIDDTVPAEDSERVTVWRHPEQVEPSCMMVERRRSGIVGTAAIVPPTDSDCDHVLLAECSPYVPNAMTVQSSFPQGNCLRVTPTPFAPVCMIGGPVCTDGSPLTSNACDSLDVQHCLPAPLCECAPRDALCLFNKFTMGISDGSVTHFSCTVPITATGELCPDVLHATLDGSDLLSPGTSCKAIRFVKGFLVGMSLSDALPLNLTAKLTLDGFAAPCAINVGFEGSLGNSASYSSIEPIDLELDNGKHIDVPVLVKTTPNCAEDFACTLNLAPNDSITLCGQAMF